MVPLMITDPLFFAAAIPAIILVGLSKGGFGGAIGMLGVPIMALVISPVQAAAIFLPILICMDLVGLYAYQDKANWPMLKTMLPFAILGIAIGWLLADQVNEQIIRLIVGLAALAFVADYLWQLFRRKQQKAKGNLSAAFWGCTSGFTSFIAHAGGPPYQIHSLPLGMNRITYAATAVYFFAIVNAIKLIPYFALGQFSTTNLTTTLVLLPLAPLAMLTGIWLVTKINQTFFYRMSYGAMFIIAIKLCGDSLASVFSL